MATNADPVLDVNKVVSNLIASAAQTAARGAFDTLKAGANSLTQLFTNAYTDYLQTTYHRVSTIKTFINPQQPVDLYSNFVSMRLRSAQMMPTRSRSSKL